MKGNILILDGSDYVRFQIKYMLEQNGYKVYEASYGRQVINQNFSKELKLNDIDLIFLESFLPDIDGREVLKFLNKNFPEIPVIVISVTKQKNKIIEFIDMGARDYLVKPIDKSNLLPRIEKILVKTTSEQSLSEETSSFNLVSAKSKKPTMINEKKSEKAKIDIGEVLLEEIDRAVRSDSSLVVMKASGEKSYLERIYEISIDKLRFIDTIYLGNNLLVLILPITGEKGSEIVKEKILAPIDEDDGPKFVKVLFPQDISKELIDQYKIDEICKYFLQFLFRDFETD